MPNAIDMFAGRIKSGAELPSIVRMLSSGGWKERGQRRKGRQYAVMPRGMAHGATRSEVLEVRTGRIVTCRPGKRVQYHTPGSDGFEYLAVCLPTFSPDTVHRDATWPS